MKTFKTYLPFLTIVGISVGLSVGILPALAQAKAPSSEIPEKREFPLSQKVSPCEDFHLYVCQEAEEGFQLRPDRSRHDFAFSDSDERLLKKRMEFIKTFKSQKGLDARSEQVRLNYVSCMDTKARAKEEKSFISEKVKELGSLKSKEQLVEWILNQIPKGMSSILVFDDMPDQDDSLKMNAALIGRTMLLPDQKYYEKKDVTDAFQGILADFLLQAGFEKEKENAKKRAEKLFAFDKEGALAFPEPAVQRQRWSEKRFMTKEQVVSDYPALNLKGLMDLVPGALPVFIPFPEGLKFINTKLDSSWTELRDLIAYKIMADRMDESYHEFYQERFDFNKKFFGGPEKRPELKERCAKYVDRAYTKEFDNILVKKLFPKFDDSKLKEVAARIRASIVNGLNANKWLSDSGRKEAIQKMDLARLQLVGPATDREWNFLPVAKYSATQFIGNQLTRSKLGHERILKELTEPVNQDEWHMGPLTVNAYYSHEENKFVLPMGILQYPFFDASMSVIENLGAVGTVFGHEMGHGIDDVGSKYDEKGRLRQWMSMKDLKEISERSSRLVELFNQRGHNGKLTLGENTADLVGVSFAYNAAFPENKGTLEDKKSFFVAYARLWCDVMRPGSRELLLKTDPHAMPDQRINAQVIHQPGFYEAYQCKSGDKMFLPEKDRVSIW